MHHPAKYPSAKENVALMLYCPNSGSTIGVSIVRLIFPESDRDGMLIILALVRSLPNTFNDEVAVTSDAPSNQSITRDVVPSG